MKRWWLVAVLATVLVSAVGCGRVAPGVKGMAEDGSAVASTVAGPPAVAAPNLTGLEADEGPELVRVPLVKGRTESRAKQRLKAAGFKVKVVSAGSAEERGTVIAQKPSRSKVKPGETITITVSSGGGGSGKTSGGGSSESDSAASRAFERHQSGIELEGEGAVTKVLEDDNDGGRHQRFILRLASGQTLLIAHNIDIAPRVAGLSAGDAVAFSGVYEWNSQGGVVHWTHHDPSGQHRAGWLKHEGSTYK